MDQTSDSKISLGSNDRGDELPLYGDVNNNPSPSPLETSLPGGHQSNTNAYPPVYVDKTVAGEPQALYDLICEQARLPPRVLLHITGYSTAFRVQTFNFSFDLTSTLLQLDFNDGKWNELKVVRDGDGVEAYRGGWTTSLKWEHGFHFGRLRTEKDLENGYSKLEGQRLLQVSENGSKEAASSLMAWCERFCRDPAAGKTFTLERKLEGFDQDALLAEAIWYLRSMNFKVEFVTSCRVLNTSLKVYSPHWYSHFRESIYAMPLRFCLYPLFTYMEGRYEVVRSVWRSSRTVKDAKAQSGLSKVYAHGRNEAKLVDFWSAAIAQAVRDRENLGRVLGLEYLESLQARAQERWAHVGPFLQAHLKPLLKAQKSADISTPGTANTAGSG
ncbi:unnamed protein product, partial [Penicillium manginii]|jgi:hypothetical protein